MACSNSISILQSCDVEEARDLVGFQGRGVCEFRVAHSTDMGLVAGMLTWWRCWRGLCVCLHVRTWAGGRNADIIIVDCEEKRAPTGC